MAIDRWLSHPPGQPLYVHHPELKSTEMGWDGGFKWVMMDLVLLAERAGLGVASQALSLAPSAYLQLLIRICKCWRDEMWADSKPLRVSGVSLAIL